MQLVEAANKLALEPNAILLRYLQTLTEIASEKSSTILFPMPMELMKGLFNPDSEKKITVKNN